MKKSSPDAVAAAEFLKIARHSLRRHHLPRILECLEAMSDEQVWWRPNAASNSAGNLALHLAGNVRQWIVAGMGGAPDNRRRDAEFAEKGPLLPRAQLTGTLTAAVNEACRVLQRLPTDGLDGIYKIQGFRVSGWKAVHHVVEHFALHTGQITYIAKQQLATDLGFTRLPVQAKKPSQAQKNLRPKVPVL